MPNFNCHNELSGVKLQEPKKLTKFACFNLTTYGRGDEKQKKLDEQVQREEEERLAALEFKAMPITSQAMEGNFEVVKSKKAPTKPQSQKLASQDRSKQRQLFE